MYVSVLVAFLGDFFFLPEEEGSAGLLDPATGVANVS